jgi:hypothetical protein
VVVVVVVLLLVVVYWFQLVSTSFFQIHISKAYSFCKGHYLSPLGYLFSVVRQAKIKYYESQEGAEGGRGGIGD